MQSEPTHIDTAPATNTSLHWRSTDPAPRFRDAIYMVAVLSLWFAALCGFVVLIAFILVTMVVLVRGENWLAMAAGWLDPELWLMLAAVCVAIPASLVPWMLLFRDVEAFLFDSERQILETVERRAWFSPRTHYRPFSAIQSIRPINSSSDNYLLVDVINARGRPRRLELAKGQTMAVIETYARWLALHFGDKLQPTHIYQD